MKPYTVNYGIIRVFLVEDEDIITNLLLCNLVQISGVENPYEIRLSTKLKNNLKLFKKTIEMMHVVGYINVINIEFEKYDDDFNNKMLIRIF